jgi:glycosyltransferase involved in cell wall biosynthesis
MRQPIHLILTPLYPPPRFGGIEKIVQRLAEGLAQTRDKVLVFSFQPGTPPSVHQDQVAGVAVHRIACAPTLGSFASMVSSQDEMIQAVLSAHNGRRRTAIIHAHDWFVGPAALALREHFGLPLLTIFHSDKRTEYGNRIDGDRQKIHELQKRLAHESDGILCYSNFMRGCIATSLEVLPERIGTFVCGMDENVPEPVDTSSATLLYLGRLAPEKDVGTLVRAFSRVKQRRPDCKLRIIGDGSQKTALQELIGKLGLHDAVSLLPFTSSQQRIDQELLGAKALILPSIFEPFGLVVLEAISRHVPVIVSASGGPAEIVCDGVTGWCFTPGNDQELTEKILECLENPALASTMASAALQDARGRFRWGVAVSMLRSTCVGLLSHRTGSPEGVKL